MSSIWSFSWSDVQNDLSEEINDAQKQFLLVRGPRNALIALYPTKYSVQ